MHQNDAEAMQQTGSIQPLLAPSSQSTPHTLNHPTSTTPCLLPPNKSRKHRNPVIFNPATPSRITTRKISQQPQVRSYGL